jgi:hypothetical protein
LSSSASLKNLRVGTNSFSIFMEVPSQLKRGGFCIKKCFAYNTFIQLLDVCQRSIPQKIAVLMGFSIH